MEAMPDWMSGQQEAVSAPMNLAGIMLLANRAVALDSLIEEAAAEVQRLESEQARILRAELPEALEALGLSEIKLEDGSKVGITSSISASISVANKPLAFQWLRDNDFDGIIKTKVVAQFGKGESEEAAEAVAALSEIGVSAEVDETVHPATLKAFVKERLECGDSLPTDVFGVYDFKLAKITKPRKK